MTDYLPQQSVYIAKINKSIDYIDQHLEKAFTLEELASVANFSKFHFTRIFQSIVGESPFQFIMRVRLEKAAMYIITQKQESITEIAYKFGFSDIAIFSRNFKQLFGVAPSQYRRQKHNLSNFSQMESNCHQSPGNVIPYICQEFNTLKWKSDMELLKHAEVRELPDMTVAYIRHIGPYQGDNQLFERLWNKLFAWAGPRGLIGGKDFRSLIIYHDDPNVTTGDKLRMSVCITVPADTKTDGEIGKMQLDAANYLIARFVLGPQDFQQAWDWVYGQWLPTSGYQPDDKPCFEMYPEEPKDGKFTVEICVPVKPA